MNSLSSSKALRNVRLQTKWEDPSPTQNANGLRTSPQRDLGLSPEKALTKPLRSAERLYDLCLMLYVIHSVPQTHAGEL